MFSNSKLFIKLITNKHYKMIFKFNKFNFSQINNNEVVQNLKENKNFKSKKLSFQEKHSLIIKSQSLEDQKNKKEILFSEEKLYNTLVYEKITRSLAYLNLFPLIWLNPFSIKYSFLLLFSNYYLVFLTSLEIGNLFSLGLLKYNLMTTNFSNSEIENLKIKNNRKRLFVCFTLFFFLILSGKLAYNYNNTKSLILLVLINIALYIKISYHISLNILDRNLFFKRMKYISLNILLCLMMIAILRNKDKFVTNNLLY